MSRPAKGHTHRRGSNNRKERIQRRAIRPYPREWDEWEDPYADDDGTDTENDKIDTPDSEV